MNQNRRKQKGFTLIELLIVLAIIGMLAAIVGPPILDKFAQSQPKVAAAQIAELETAIASYRLDVGKYPRSLEDLMKSNGSKTWSGPYLKKALPRDPWGNAYQYQAPGKHKNAYDLYSFGADGREGGEGENADIVNW